MTGLIAFFDILGYQTFLSNTTAEESVNKVLALITETPTKVTKKFAHWVEAKNAPNQEEREVANSVQHLVFSDTIVLYIKHANDTGNS
jgi:hypothetical protein